MDSDSLRSIRNNFYVGLYEDAAREAKSLEGNKELSLYAQQYYYRSLVYSNPGEVISKINNNHPTSLQAVKQFAIYLSDQDSHDKVLALVNEWNSSDLTSNDSTLQIMSAYIYINEKDYKLALQTIINDKQNLEKLLLTIIIYLYLNRFDLAGNQLKLMAEIDEDDPTTQLAGIYINLSTAFTSNSSNNEKINETQAAISELIEKFGQSVLLLNLQAVASMVGASYSSAFTNLKSSRDMAIQNNTKPAAETLINSIICLNQLNKGKEITSKITAELRQSYPQHTFFNRQIEIDAAFDKCAANYTYKQ
jgi:coatomer protein complex subunit epsilon